VRAYPRTHLSADVTSSMATDCMMTPGSRQLPVSPDVGPSIDWALMQALLLVSEAGSYRSAAKSVSLNTLRKRVAELERRTGAPLLAASVSGVVPTTAGLRLVATAKAMREALETGLSVGVEVGDRTRERVHTFTFHQRGAFHTAALTGRWPHLAMPVGSCRFPPPAHSVPG
jgi:Bacterial regulatory helix-turn-helix protein, lysR family